MTQYARPNTDISKTGWTGVSDNTNLYSNIDESSASEADYNYSTHNAIRTYECKLSGVSDPSSGSGHVVSYRIAASDSIGSIPGSGDSGNSLDVAISVYQGTTLIATTTITVPEDPETQTLTLSSGEANAITDYSDLRIRFVTTASGGSGSSRRGMAVFWCELAVPNAPTEQYAVKSGNWNDTTVWSTGAVPTTGDVFSNGYTVTVNVNASATKITNKAGVVAVAGGSFALADGVTLTANVEAGAATCLVAGTSVGGAIIGDIYGGSSTNAYGFQKLGSVVKTVTITGNSYGGSGTGATAILNSSNGPINQTGNAYGGTMVTAFGHRNSGSAHDTITGHSYAGDAAYGAFNASSGNITVTGNSYAADSVAGSANGASGSVTIGGNSIGSAASTSYGVLNYGSGTVTVTGAAISADSPGLGPGIANTGSGYSIVGTIQTGTSGVSPCVGHVHVADLSAFTALVRSSSSSVTLSAEVGLPSPFEPSSVFGGA
jgi:hypothetical protein